MRFIFFSLLVFLFAPGIATAQDAPPPMATMAKTLQNTCKSYQSLRINEITHQAITPADLDRLHRCQSYMDAFNDFVFLENHFTTEKIRSVYKVCFQPADTVNPVAQAKTYGDWLQLLDNYIHRTHVVGDDNAFFTLIMALDTHYQCAPPQ